jgi:hypothetical protein
MKEKSIIKIHVTGPTASGKSLIADEIAYVLRSHGMEVVFEPQREWPLTLKLMAWSGVSERTRIVIVETTCRKKFKVLPGQETWAVEPDPDPAAPLREARTKDEEDGHEPA